MCLYLDPWHGFHLVLPSLGETDPSTTLHHPLQRWRRRGRRACALRVRSIATRRWRSCGARWRDEKAWHVPMRPCVRFWNEHEAARNGRHVRRRCTFRLPWRWRNTTTTWPKRRRRRWWTCSWNTWKIRNRACEKRWSKRHGSWPHVDVPKRWAISDAPSCAAFATTSKGRKRRRKEPFLPAPKRTCKAKRATKTTTNGWWACFDVPMPHPNQEQERFVPAPKVGGAWKRR
mmetsp:Transcript_4009/g.25201  ORF Transcript_4009/g.25201 Transcript_4009/m.25201 type:complete len:231 (-) Transcript_4009:2538-3230(-)